VVAGNLAFRQSATSAGDWGVETARAYLRTTLIANQSALDADNEGQAYYATWQSALDLYGTGVGPAFEWDDAHSKLVGTDSAGNQVRYVVHRLCQFGGSSTSAGANCVRTSATGSASAAEGSTKGASTYGSATLPAPTAVYFRVTVGSSTAQHPEFRAGNDEIAAGQTAAGDEHENRNRKLVLATRSGRRNADAGVVRQPGFSSSRRHRREPIKPNVMFILDDSGSMASIHADYVNEGDNAGETSSCFDGGDDMMAPAPNHQRHRRPPLMTTALHERT
jgi:hypothetical protein